MEEFIDNPIWNALTTRHSHLSINNGDARRYPLERTRLAALERWSPENLASLRETMPVNKRIGFFYNPVNDDSSAANEFFAPGWRRIVQADVAQMICWNPQRRLPCEFETLTIHDVSEMTSLAELTKPGPFGPQTIEFGTFIGIKLDGKLVAMCGERMKISPNFDEVSAVCTHPDFQGRGYAKALVSEVSNRITERDAVPILHVLAANAGAIKSYEANGFSISKIFSYLIAEAI